MLLKPTFSRSVYLFRIDFSERAVPIVDWTCFLNSCWVMTALVVLCTLTLLELRKRSSEVAHAATGSEEVKKTVSRRQRRALLQAFLICLFIFVPASMYAAAGFIPIPPPMLKFAAITLQMCSGLTGIVYLMVNSTIRRSVARLLFGERAARRTLEEAGGTGRGTGTSAGGAQG